MYGAIFAGEGITVYDTDSDEYIGQKLNEYYDTSPKSIEKIKEGFSRHKPFELDLRDGATKVSLFFVPVTYNLLSLNAAIEAV